MSTSSSKVVSTLVKLTWGDPLDPTPLLLTDANEKKTTSKGEFIPDPKLRIEAFQHLGTLDEPIRKIDLSDGTHNFLEEITSGVAFPPVKVTVWEYHEETSGVTFYTAFTGKVTRAIKNPKGRSSIFQLQVAGSKKLLDEQRAGIAMLDLCDNTFADGESCKVDITRVQETGTITSVTKQTVTITGLSTQGIGYWVPGFIEYQGLRIKIVGWDGSTSFTLARIPRESWDGASVTVYPGCDNSSAVCEGRWKNLADFNGLGIAMPSYHPVMENPRGT